MTHDAEIRSPADAVGLAHLWGRLSRVERRVRAVVAARRATDPDPDDPYRGQYLTPEAMQRVLDGPSAFLPPEPDRPPPAEPPHPASRLARLAADFGLSALDVELLLIVVAPDVDARFERFYGYLNDDLFRCRPTIGLALELCGLPAAGEGRFRFSPSAPLVKGGLVEVGERQRPFLTRALAVPDRVSGHLLGDDEVDAALRGAVALGPAAAPAPDEVTRRAAAAATTGCGLVHLLDQGGDAARVAVEALVTVGGRPLVLDPAALATGTAPDAVVRTLVTEARLRGAGIVMGPLEACEPERPERARKLRALCAAAVGVPLITYGTRAWDPLWSAESPVNLTVAPPGRAQRTRQWRRELADAARKAGGPGGTGTGAAQDEAFVEAVAGHRLDTAQMRRAAAVAVRTAGAQGRHLLPGDMLAAVRAQNSAGLARLARHVEPGVAWPDLVLPAPTRRQLDELALRARHRDQVLGEWRMRPGGGRGRSVTALFAGESGTGKTMSAEVIAAELGVDLYVVDLSTVVDKYIGETEKNLERIFVEASAVNGVLLFDEADAIFGKRSQVKDAHDRHANVESAYLLQRMESFDGIAVLTTNLRSNLDEAFTRRLDAIVDFPMPDTAQRRVLWDRCLGPEMPRADDLDLDFCAERFELAGGSIRACAVTAAYLAAETGKPLGMAQVMTATLQEYRKLGRLILESEFGPWAGLGRE
ncbi:ATP-binding protein [Streptomyces sp. NPDC002564]|uniref:ATP-binding protein n=1 Tax=Streptomyces sp. NPDC002564 TaxID=3364649 RepID=UPI003692C06B